MTKNVLFTALAVFTLTACGDPVAPDKDSALEPIARADGPVLSMDYAAARAGQVRNVRYAISVSLDPQLEHFEGENRIRFDWTAGPAELSIDFGGGEVNALSVNGTSADVDYQGYFITIPASLLADGENEIVVAYRHPWSTTGAGLYRYDDPDDGRTYLYTDFEPFDANQAFPLFDQPDIKGRFTLAVTAPADWHVISTGRETTITELADGTRQWEFPETPPIPTYIVSLHAGPYAVWEDDEFRIPLRLFVRESLAAYVDEDAPRWFRYTRAGFDFFENYYGVDYPYGKYDQVIVPDFNSGAMENAGAVTFNERSFVQRDGWDYKEEKWLVEVILHEMAHMWFGNLVTMKWWNGLWLNETFAEFMGYHASSRLGLFDSWKGFYLDRKVVAYQTDLRSTTHPIETVIPDTESISVNFDMISYAKGASVLRQIEFQLGEDVFREGIRRYLDRHAEGNAELEDLVTALAEAADKNLDRWAEEWLYTAGVNTVEARYSCTDGRVSEFSLVQTAPEDIPILRSQKIQVGLFRSTDGIVVTDDIIPVTYSGEVTEVPGAIGKTCPDLVYPNYEDYGYLLVKLDPRTRANLRTMIGNVGDAFQRVMFWQTMWENVRYGQMPMTDYLDAVFESAAMEDDINNVDQVYYYVGSAVRDLRRMPDSLQDTFESYRSKAEAVTWANVLRTRGDLQTMYLNRYLAFATSAEAQQGLVDILQGTSVIPGRELGQERRWKMLQVLSAEGHPLTEELLAAEQVRDPSDDGQRAALQVYAAQPDLAVKRAIYDDAVDPESKSSLMRQSLGLRALFPSGQKHLYETFVDEILAQLVENEKNPDPAFQMRAKTFAQYLVPAGCTPAAVERLEAAIDVHADSSESLRRLLISRHEDAGHCVTRAALLL